jgi:hypothetical protein
VDRRRPPRNSLYNDFIYWAQKTDVFETPTSNNAAANIHVPVQALLHLVCAEWLTIADYIRTRLGQIEWEISFPEHFLYKGSNIDVALKKLHVWRRLVPLYREMLTETLQRVLHFPCLTTSCHCYHLNRRFSADTERAKECSALDMACHFLHPTQPYSELV